MGPDGLDNSSADKELGAVGYPKLFMSSNAGTVERNVRSTSGTYKQKSNT